MKSVLLALFLSVALVSCAKKDETTVTEDSTYMAPPTTQAADITSIEFGKTLSASNELEDKSSSFAPADQIHALVHSENVPAGSTLETKWIFVTSGQSVHDESSNLAAGANATHIYVQNDKPWPAGEYRLEAKIGDDMKSETITVK